MEWQSLAERESKWTAFMSDPDWVKVKAETEKDGAFTLHITNMILAPTSFSKLK